MTNTTRREFMLSCAMAGGAVFALRAGESQRIFIESTPESSFRHCLAERELLRGLIALQLPGEIRVCDRGQSVEPNDILFRLRLAPGDLKDKESYSISSTGNSTTLKAATDSGLFYAVQDFLERQGAYFGLDGESYPPAPAARLELPGSQVWEGAPRFSVRGLLPWPDFLNCISVYNREDFRAYFEAMLRMRFNMFGVHVYTGDLQWAESYLSFEYAGVGHLGFLDNTASPRWGTIPQRTSRFGMGASDFFDGETFGTDATRLASDPWEIADKTRRMLAESLRYAEKLGISIGVGFEPYQIPDEIFRALPREVKAGNGKSFPGGARFDIESVAARQMLEVRLGQLLEAYPNVDYVWLWEDETMNWESRKTGIPLSPTPFLQAYDFLRRNAPGKKLVLAGWGGVVRHFEYFHQKLPMDVVFSSLSDSLGWDPVNEAFGKLEGRERWPIPWLEDDPSMWLPQYHVHRTKRDVGLAAEMGCQGIVGIHWRHRAVDATAGYLAKSAWDTKLTPASHFEAYARSQAVEPRSSELARVLTDADRGHTFLHTGTDQVEDGHVVTREYAADYDEGFLFWREYEPDQELTAAQSKVANSLRQIANGATSCLEQERLEYIAGFVEFAVPYTEAWRTAHRLNLVLEDAAKIRGAGHPEEAAQKVRRDGVPLWTGLAPLVRDTMLCYQRIVATRGDLGQLASMHNKFVRLALVRLRLSMQEYLGELPRDTEQLYQQVIQPDPRASAHVFVPTRPSILDRKSSVRITIVAAGAAPVHKVTLHTRTLGVAEWSDVPAKPVGRRTYEAVIGPPEQGQRLGFYYVSALIGEQRYVTPAGGERRPWLVTVCDL